MRIDDEIQRVQANRAKSFAQDVEGMSKVSKAMGDLEIPGYLSLYGGLTRGTVSVNALNDEDARKVSRIFRERLGTARTDKRVNPYSGAVEMVTEGEINGYILVCVVSGATPEGQGCVLVEKATQIPARIEKTFELYCK
jgi:hypothetical protein